MNRPDTSAGDDMKPTPSTATGVQGSDNQTNTGQPTVPPVVSVMHDAKLGDYLVATNGMTLYSYSKDTNGVSNCSGTCAANWPPYAHTVAEPLVASADVTGALTVSARVDQSQQITYKGMPLYFWKNDTKPGDITGQNVGGFVIVKP
jgi:predicted lipoprotein with Yx(FWY)xxD motif